MRATKEQKRIRDQIAFYMGEGYRTLAEPSARWLSRDIRVKGCILFLADNAPAKMKTILKDASRTAEAALKRAREDIVYEKPTHEPYGDYPARKRNKTDMDNPFAKHVLGGKPSAKDLPGTPELSSDSEDEEENNEETVTMQNDENTHVPNMQAAEHSETSIELGLTRGTVEIQTLVSGLFFDEVRVCRTRSKSDLARIFEVCTKLDFIVVKAKLVAYLTSRLSKGDTIPLTIEMEDPHQIIDALMEIDKVTVNAKIHRAYGQMRFFAVVAAITSEKGGVSHIQTLEQLASEKAGDDSKELKDQLVHKYKMEYQQGRKWLEVAKWFDGTGIALVLIAAGVGGYAVSNSWIDIHRQFLQFVSKYLPSIRRLVRSFGEYGLRDYCRDGNIPANQICAIVQVEPYTDNDDIADDTNGDIADDTNGDIADDTNNESETNDA